MADMAMKSTGAALVAAPSPARTGAANAQNDLRAQLMWECQAMLTCALDSGKALPDAAVQKFAALMAAADTPAPDAAAAAAGFADLTNVHIALSAAIAPARGHTLLLFQEERQRHPNLYVFGPVRLIRQMLAVAALALAATCLLSTTEAVDVPNVAKGWFALSGQDACLVLAFLVSVAGLGAAFSNLATINRYVEMANYDPIYEGGYWIRIVLGLISGVVLAEILFDMLVHANVNGAAALQPAGGRIVAAFLGGFATTPVQRLLVNLSDALGTLLQGKNTTPPAAAPAPPPPDQN